MNIATILFLMSTSATTLWLEDAPSYEELIDQAVHNCRNTGRRTVDEQMLWTLVDAEKRYDVPSELKGILLAQACGESGFNPKASGDYRNNRARARGLFQMWRWWEKAYGIDREVPYEAADAHMQHIVKILKKVKKRCKHRTVKKQWLAAWVTAIRAPKPGGRCKETPNHWRILKRWHKNIMQERKLMFEEYGHGDGEPCGC